MPPRHEHPLAWSQRKFVGIDGSREGRSDLNIRSVLAVGSTYALSADPGALKSTNSGIYCLCRAGDAIRGMYCRAFRVVSVRPLRAFAGRLRSRRVSES